MGGGVDAPRDPDALRVAPLSIAVQPGDEIVEGGHALTAGGESALGTDTGTPSKNGHHAGRPNAYSGGFGANPLAWVCSLFTPFVLVIRRNRRYSFLLCASFISMMGDWFTLVAAVQLLRDLQGTSAAAVSGLFIAYLLPPFLFAPIVGTVADKFDRFAIMVASDLASSLCVLAMLLVQGESTLWVLYAARFSMATLRTFFEPARSALLPQVVTRPEDLVAANSMDGVLWSLTQFMGAAAGGVVAATLGVSASFVVDSVSYVFSAMLVTVAWRMGQTDTARSGGYAPVGVPSTIAEVSDDGDDDDQHKGVEVVRGDGVDPERAGALEDPTPKVADSGSAGGAAKPDQSFCAMVTGGMSYLWHSRELLWLTIFKALNNVPMGSMDVTRVNLIESKFPATPVAVALGIIAASESVGTLITPVASMRYAGRVPERMRRCLSFSYLMTSLSILTSALSPSLPVLYVGMAAAGSGYCLQYQFTMSMLQLGVDNEFRGRVFAFSLAFRTIVSACSVTLTGIVLDEFGVDPRAVGWGVMVLNVALGVGWLCIYVARYGKSEGVGNVANIALATAPS